VAAAVDMLISEGYLFDRMVFLQYFFTFYRFPSSSIFLFFIDQSVSIIDIVFVLLNHVTIIGKG
jgi:hypothetical protein